MDDPQLEHARADARDDLPEAWIGGRKFLLGAAELSSERSVSHRRNVPGLRAMLRALMSQAAPRVPGRILVIDDDRSARTLLERVLVRAGHQVTLVDNAEQGLEAIQKLSLIHI